MQHRHHRSSRDGRMSWRPGRRTSDRDYGPKPEAPRPMRVPKEEILMRAGRLAANYLVSEGLLSPSLIRPQWDDKDRRSEDFHKSKKRDRDYKRRNHGDDYDDHRKKRRRNDGHVWELGRDRGRWRRKDWGYNDDVLEGRKDFYDDYRENRSRRRFREKRVRSKADDDDYGWKRGSWRSRRERRGDGDLDPKKVVDMDRDSDRDAEGGNTIVEDGDDSDSSLESGEWREGDDLDERCYNGRRFENEGDSKYGDELGQDGVEEVSFKPHSRSTSREPPTTYAFDLNIAASECGWESDGEVKMDVGDDLNGKFLEGSDGEGKSFCEDSDGGLESVGEVNGDGNDGDDLVKSCSFRNLPTKSRASVGRRSPIIDPLLASKADRTVVIAAEVPEVIVGEDVMGGLSSDSGINLSNSSKGEGFAVLSITPIQNVVEYEDNETELLGKPVKPGTERILTDEEMVTGYATDQEKPVQDESFGKFDAKVKLEVEEFEPPVYKVCDLNLMAPPETIEVQDGHIFGHLHTSVHVSEAGREFPAGLGDKMGDMPSITTGNFWLSKGRMIPVIDLEDDSSTELDAYDSSKPRSQNLYSSSVNLGGKGDFSAILEFHRTDVSVLGCPLASSDLSNP